MNRTTASVLSVFEKGMIPTRPDGLHVQDLLIQRNSLDQMRAAVQMHVDRKSKMGKGAQFVLNQASRSRKVVEVATQTREMVVMSSTAPPADPSMLTSNAQAGREDLTLRSVAEFMQQIRESTMGYGHDSMVNEIIQRLQEVNTALIDLVSIDLKPIQTASYDLNKSVHSDTTFLIKTQSNLANKSQYLGNSSRGIAEWYDIYTSMKSAITSILGEIQQEDPEESKFLRKGENVDDDRRLFALLNQQAPVLNDMLSAASILSSRLAALHTSLQALATVGATSNVLQATPANPNAMRVGGDITSRRLENTMADLQLHQRDIFSSFQLNILTGTVAEMLGGSGVSNFSGLTSILNNSIVAGPNVFGVGNPIGSSGLQFWSGLAVSALSTISRGMDEALVGSDKALTIGSDAAIKKGGLSMLKLGSDLIRAGASTFGKLLKGLNLQVDPDDAVPHDEDEAGGV